MGSAESLSPNKLYATLKFHSYQTGDRHDCAFRGNLRKPFAPLA